MQNKIRGQVTILVLRKSDLSPNFVVVPFYGAGDASDVVLPRWQV